MKKIVVLIMGMLVAVGANAAVLSFEDGDNGVNVTDNMAVTTNYQATAGVTFYTGVQGNTDYGSFSGNAFIEQMGDQGLPNDFGTNNAGFLNAGQLDRVAQGVGLDGSDVATRNSLMGDYFLRTSSFSTDSLAVIYDGPVTSANFQIWDIDGLNGVDSEEWTINAFLGNWTTPVDTYITFESFVNGDAASYNGQALDITLNTVPFDRFVIEFTGNKVNSVGLAFNGFNTTIPEPSTISMMALVGLIALFIRRHFAN